VCACARCCSSSYVGRERARMRARIRMRAGARMTFAWHGAQAIVAANNLDWQGSVDAGLQVWQKAAPRGRCNRLMARRAVARCNATRSDPPRCATPRRAAGGGDVGAAAQDRVGHGDARATDGLCARDDVRRNSGPPQPPPPIPYPPYPNP
jgi:hypothetical protein